MKKIGHEQKVFNDDDAFPLLSVFTFLYD